MSFQSAVSPQFPHDNSTPPPPPPKPQAHAGGSGTPLSGPPLPPPPPSERYRYTNQDTRPQSIASGHYQVQQHDGGTIRLPEEGWLPEGLRDKTTTDLHHILEDPKLLNSLALDPKSTHPSLKASETPIKEILSANLALANSLKALEARLLQQRQSAQSRLLSLRALERQWRAKQSEQDTALQNFSPPVLYQRLSAAAGDQDALCRTLEESFLEGEGDSGGAVASEREISEFVRRLREGKKTAYLRRERKERWDEGRVGGWR